MSNRLIVGAAAAALLLQASIGAFAATSPAHGLDVRRAGDHYTTVLNNDVRDCVMLDSEFRQAARGPHAAASADAEALHQQGAKLCQGGAGEAGAVKEAQAIHAEGAIPRLY
ncbi:MAG TPA: hypothetical protein VMQ73_19040 [Methylomirabilota bacterium]|nr:hypothetical protein [Methylomirabilota bacterium]